jgi:hypothetical protein
MNKHLTAVEKSNFIHIQIILPTRYWWQFPGLKSQNCSTCLEVADKVMPSMRVVSFQYGMPDRASEWVSRHMHVQYTTNMLRSCPTQDRRGRDLIVFGFTTIYAISAYHHYRCEFKSSSNEVFSIQHYVIKFVIGWRQVGGFLRVLRFHPPIKLTATI